MPRAAAIGPVLAGVALLVPVSGAVARVEAPVPRAPTRAVAWVARVVAPTVARVRPDGAARALQRVDTRARWNGGPVGLLVRAVRRDSLGRLWLHVDLRRRPNGSRGWIRADYARLAATAWRIEISTRARRLRLLRRGRVVARARVVVGAAGTPTPHGRFAVSERVRQPPGSALGPWALHLTSFSDVLDDYGGGPGRVAIHGRAGPLLLDALGTAASHGCIRVQDAVVRRLARVAVEGTPVTIRR